MKKILLVEDDAAIAELERDYLEADGFAVDISADGDAGKRLAMTGDYDLLLLDVMLPGADDYIIKPFSPSELAARVKAHLARYERLKGSAGDAAVLRFGALEIQPQTRRVFLGGNEVILAAREFDLLLFLAQHPQVVFSKETLYDRVWEMDAMGSTATVSVHINRLREKLERDPAHPQWLQTVWGAGYRFNDGM